MTTPQTGLYLVPQGRGTRPKRGKYQMRRHEVYQGTFKIDGVPCRLIALTNGKTAIVDAADYDDLSQFSWCARCCQDTGNRYAIRTVHEGQAHWEEAMHRRVLGLSRGDRRKGDHVEVDQTLDNRRKNLRMATHGQNRMNSHLQRNSTTGHKGVSFHKAKGRYVAYIGFEGRHIRLGSYPAIEQAIAARREASLQLHKDFRREA